MIVLAVVTLMVPIIVNAAFSDVPEDHWAASYINELTSKGVINGYPDGTYGPSITLTKGQFLKLIVSASFGEFNVELIDTDFEHWAAPYVKVAENYKAIEKGSITKENVDEPISRIEVVRILGICDINMRDNAQKTAEKMEFNDISSITNQEYMMLSHAVANAIISGYPDGSFKPENSLTRAEAAKILSVYMNME